MYLPNLFKSNDYELLKQLVKEQSFSSLITSKGKIRATKAMMLLNETATDTFFIETHIGRANPVAKNIEQGDEVLCDFIGSHTYISSSWYDHLNVSTWNYEAVQIYGTVEMMTNEEFYQHLKKLTDIYEAPQKCPVTVEKMGRDFVEKEMKGAIGLKVIPKEIAIKQKLSQNRDDFNYYSIIKQLEYSEELMDKRIAESMKLIRPS